MRPGKNATLGGLLMLVVFAASSVALYAGAKAIEPGPSANAEEPLPGGEVPTRSVIVAETLKFNRSTIVAPAGASYTITVDNRDAGVLHNIAFYTSRAATQQIYVGELFPGPAVRDFQFTVPALPGNFFFRCDVHPDTMSGTFRVQ